MLRLRGTSTVVVELWIVQVPVDTRQALYTQTPVVSEELEHVEQGKLCICEHVSIWNDDSH